MTWNKDTKRGCYTATFTCSAGEIDPDTFLDLRALTPQRYVMIVELAPPPPPRMTWGEYITTPACGL